MVSWERTCNGPLTSMSSPAPPLAQGTKTRRSMGMVKLVFDATAEKAGTTLRADDGVVGVLSHAVSAAAATMSRAARFMRHLRIWIAFVPRQPGCQRRKLAAATAIGYGSQGWTWDRSVWARRCVVDRSLWV